MASLRNDRTKEGDVVYKSMNTVFGKRSPQEHAAHLVPHIEIDHDILDVGCGVGSITLGLAKLAPHGKTCGIDLTPDSIAIAREAARRENIVNISFDSADVTTPLPFADESFDIVHAHQVLVYLTDPVTTLAEMRRVLRPGGVLAIRDSASRQHIPANPVIERIYAIFDKIIPDPGFGFRSHLAVHKAGFEWHRMQMSSWAVEYSGPEQRKLWYEGARDSPRTVYLAKGLATEQELDEHDAAYDKWLNDESGRIMMLDGAVLAFK